MGETSNMSLFCHSCALSVLLFCPVIFSRNVAWSVDFSVFKSLLYFPFEASHFICILYAFLSHSKFHFLLIFQLLSTISDSLENKPSLRLLEVSSKMYLPQVARGLTWPQRCWGILYPLPRYSIEADNAPCAQLFPSWIPFCWCLVFIEC